MRQILMILFTLITCTASAQLYQRMPQYGYEMDRGRILLDLDIPTDTTTNKSGVVRIGATLYAGNGTYWTAAATGTFDTSGIRIRPIPGTYMTITGTYPNLTFNVIYDSTVLQTKFRSDTNRTNVYTTLDTIIKYVSSPDGSVGITSSGRNIYFTVTGAPNSASPGNYIILYPTIERSNDTVDVIPNIVFQQGALRDTITTGAQYIVPYASAGQKRIDPIIIDPSGLLDTLQGVEDSFFAVRPDLAAGSIVIADINVYGTDSIVVSNVGLFPQTALGYFDANGKLTGDSTKYFVGSNILNAPAFKSNVVGGVALQMGNGSDIRSDERMYLTSASTMMFRTNGFGKRMAIYPSGNVGIGGPDTDVPSAILNLFDSTSKGFLPPVMRGVRMNAISSPATGLIVYNSDSASLCLWNGSAWVKLGTGGGSGTSGWGLTGNAVSPTTEFLGSTNDSDVIIKANNFQVARFISEYNSFLFGEPSTITGSHSGAFGSDHNVSGNYSMAFNSSNIISGDQSTAFGDGNNVSGNYSFAAGQSTIASGSTSFVIGNSNTASGAQSFASGLNTAAYGEKSASFGNGTVAKSATSLVIGRFNDTTGQADNDTTALFQIGNGYASGERSNIVTVKHDSIILNLPSKGSGKVLTSDANGAATWQTPGGGSGITRGTTAITSGTSTRVLYDSAGIVGEYGISGTGSVAMTASPTFTGLITSPALTLTSTTTGFIPNSVTTTQMNAITPTNGMMVYNTDEGSMFTYNTDWGWESNSLKYNTVFGTQYFNDLLGIIPASTAATQDGNIAISTSGGAVTTFTTPTANRQGIIELSTSTSATGRSYIATSNQTTAQSMVLGGGRILYETSVQVPTLSTSGERFAFVSGFTTTMNNINIQNGAAFLYDEGGVAPGSAASANWQVLTAAGGSRTYTTTATVVTAGQWYKLQVIVNAAATSVGFYIDGTLVHTETSTIPSAAIGFANQIIKSNGTTARSVLVDYVYLKQKYTTAK